MKTVLVIDDASLARKLRAGLSRQDRRTAILEGGDSSDAIALVEKSPDAVDLIVMGRRAARGSGRDLVGRMRQQGMRNIPIIVVTSARDEERVLRALEIEGPSPGSDRTTEVSLNKIQRAMPVKSRRETVMRGGFELFALPELIHFIHSVKRSGRLEITTGGDRAAVDFHDGEVIDARYGGLRGTEAFFALISGDFEGYRFVGDDDSAEDGSAEPSRAIATPTLALLMEAARRLDEGAACS